ncbi:MAG: A/G-specific adenine glycosylase, partial [Chitinophagaceae bacterium]
RKMPWKGEKDPYKIWLSEIILQQTRVEQGWNYYNRFIDAFPTIRDLANAPDQVVFKLWEGLGYYARCRNLLHTARRITNEHNGSFPETYEDIIKLKGVGPYTAAAISSFAFGLPYAVVDGNVLRVLSRVFGIQEPIDGKEGRSILDGIAEKLLDKKSPGLYNQAIMDFGAVICKPALPLCNTCPVQKICVAFKKDMVDKLPVKTQKMVRRKRWFYYFLLEKNGRFLVCQRTQKDIWQHLNEFFLIETSQRQSAEKLMESKSIQALLKEQGMVLPTISNEYKQVLTHQEIRGRFFHIILEKKIIVPPNFKWVNAAELKKMAFPKFILSYMGENG